VINESSGRSWATLQRIPDHVLPRTFDYGFSMPLLQKDVSTALRLASSENAPVPLLRLVGELVQNSLTTLGPLADHVEVARGIEKSTQVTFSATSSLRSSTSSPSLSALGIELVVFDMAGTTVDEGMTVYETLAFALREYGQQIDMHSKDFEMWHGANKIEAIRHFLTKAGRSEDEVQSCFKLFLSTLEASYFGPNSTVKEIKGAKELFGKLRQKGIKVALNTGYPRATANALIEKVSFVGAIDDSVVAEEVGMGRPYPYMIHHLMRRFNVLNPRKVAKVGDTVRDVEEGRYSGCGLVIGVLSGAEKQEELVAAGADLIIPSVADIVP